MLFIKVNRGIKEKKRKEKKRKEKNGLFLKCKEKVKKIYR
jgi:hypothetical protein